jgi:hypothetical protein
MTTQPDTPLVSKSSQDKECGLGLLGTILIVFAACPLILLGVSAYHTFNPKTPEGFITGQEVILSHDRDTKGDPYPDRAKHLYQPKDVGQITYCDPDAYGRPTCAYGLLTAANNQAGDNYQRTEITIDPTGWPAQNDQWLKTPLISPALGGEIQKNNLIPATRPYHKTFDEIEQKVKDYLSNPGNAQCPLYYAVTPNYEGDELIPRTVTVDIESCDHVLSERHTLYNVTVFYSTQEAISYRTGEIWKR